MRSFIHLLATRRRAVLLGAALLTATPALAQDFSAEAKARMGLSFDLDEVEGMLHTPYPYTDLPPGSQLSVLPLEPNSEVDSVTVYRDRALITRVLTADVTPDAPAVSFEGLPLGLVTEGLHASLREGEGRILGVEVESGLGEVEETERVEALRDEMLELTEELGQIRDRIEALLAQRAYLRASLLAGPGDGPRPALTEVQRSLEYVGESEREIAAKLRKEQEAAEELGEDLEPLLVKLENPRATGIQVRVDVEVDAPTEVTVALHYLVHGARWVPYYNARLDEDASQVELEYHGVVAQTTGEDWTDAELLLSTADPSISSTLPTLDPWHLGWDGYGVRDGLEYGHGLYEEGAGYAVTGVPSTGVVASEMAAGVQGSGAVVFAIPGRRTVTGDGSSQRLPVGTQTLAATLELATVPKRVPEVFRLARIQYAGDIPLIPGPVASHVGGDYVGTGHIDAVIPGESLDLSFGTDDRLRVSRRLVSREQEYVGVGRRTVRYSLEFRIEVTNHTDAEQVVEIVDQLPVSEQERVTVKVLELSEERTVDEADPPGLLRWTRAIPSGGTTSVTLAFSVTAPAEVAQSWGQDLMYLH